MATAKIMATMRALNFPTLHICTEYTLPYPSAQLYGANRTSLASIDRETEKIAFTATD
jgi:hypothetical protein